MSLGICMNKKWMAVLLVIGMLLALFIGGAQPFAIGLFAEPWDKVAHAGFFCLLAVLMARFVGLHAALVIALALLFGAADEIHQSFLPGRVAGLDDWMADIAGACIGCITGACRNPRTV
jgi:VanZ family protein